jgi:RAP1 GTPase activating protein 1
VSCCYNYDEHVLVNNFNIYQKLHQTSEEALFGNRNYSLAIDKFLDMIGQSVALSEHRGYRGGFDTQFVKTGQHSVYTEHMGKEVMYHVATLLPFSETDTQQLQCKCHIGNDIVSLVPGGIHPLHPRHGVIIFILYMHLPTCVTRNNIVTDYYRVK